MCNFTHTCSIDCIVYDFVKEHVPDYQIQVANSFKVYKLSRYNGINYSRSAY